MTRDKAERAAQLLEDTLDALNDYDLTERQSDTAKERIYGFIENHPDEAIAMSGHALCDKMVWLD